MTTAAHRACGARALQLQARYAHIASTRMRDVALCHPLLEVAAVGFEPQADEPVAVGVLVTPWFMNLVRLPLALDVPVLAVGVSATRALGVERFDFIGAHDDEVGAYEACSLFSPMDSFANQLAAVATAEAVLSLLRAPPPPAPAPPEPVPPRRRFFTGARGAAA